MSSERRSALSPPPRPPPGIPSAAGERRSRLERSGVGGRHGAIALAWAALTFAVAWSTAPAQGIGRDEGVYLVAAESYAAWWGDAARAPSRALASIDRRFEVNHEHPPLTKTVYGATHALLAEGLGATDHLQGFRAGAFLFAAALSAVLALWGGRLAGTGGALLAPALFWAVPRHFYHAHPAALDLAATATWLAVVAAYARSLRAPRQGDGGEAGGRWAGRLGWPVATGVLLGLALAVKHNAWFLPPLLAAHALAARGPALVRARSWRERLALVPLALPAMAVLGPAVLVASWPWLWRDPARRLAGYVAFHLHHENYSWQYLGRLLREPPFPVAYPFVVTALTVPAAVLLAYAGGFAHGLARLAAAWRAPAPAEASAAGAVARGEAAGAAVQAHPAQAMRAGAPDASTELLLLLNALFPIALIAWPTVPIFGGVKHWMPAMPFLALLGTRAIVAAARALAPRRAGLAAAALGAVTLAPACWAVAHVHPYGTAAYNELAGGAPGAATLGMQRQFWGDDVVGALDALGAHAAPRARVWWQETAWYAVQAWQRDGRVRRDLRWVNGPEDADISIWHYHQEFRDKEFRTWTAFAGPRAPGEPPPVPRPVAGVYLDEVPLVQIYARPGAWR